VRMDSDIVLDPVRRVNVATMELQRKGGRGQS
jgi:hypothetical protein